MVEWLSVKEVARQLGKSQSFVYIIIHTGQIQCAKFGGTYHFKPEWVADYIERNTFRAYATDITDFGEESADSQMCGS